MNELTEFRNICSKANSMINNCEEIKIEESSDLNIYSMLEFANSAGDYVDEIEKKTYIKNEPLSSDYSDSYLSDHFLDNCTLVNFEESKERKNNCKYKIYWIISEQVELKPLKRNKVYLYICPKCNQSVKDIAKHFEEHTDYYSKLEYGCKECNFRCLSLIEMQHHQCLRSVKSSKIYFNCEQCSFQTKQKGNLKTHSLTHKKPDEIPMFQCPHCKFQSRQKGNLQTHLLVHKKREEIPMFKCPHCKFQSRQKGNLQTHLLKKHKGSQESELVEALLLKCKRCPYKVKQSTTLKKHMALCHM